MGSGGRFTLDFHGDGLTQITVDAPAADGQTSNDGRILADGGSVTLAALGDRDGDGSAIIHSGLIRANSIEHRQGHVLLSGGAGTVLIRGGEIDVSAPGSQRGGAIDILGGHVGIVERASPNPDSLGASLLDASGGGGGGTIAVRGSGVIAFDGRSRMQANATNDGHGGTINLLGTDGVRAFGSLAVRGGPNGGDGGLIDTSTGRGIDLRGIDIDASAARGRAGTWLIDPMDVDIVHGDDSGEIAFAPFAFVTTSTVQDSDINAALDSGSSVIIDTYMADDEGSTGGDIVFVSTLNAAGLPITPEIIRSEGSAPLTLELRAHRSITGIVENANGERGGSSGFTISAGDGPLNVLFNANANGEGPGGIDVFQADIFSNGGDVMFYGNSNSESGFSSSLGLGVSVVDTDITTAGAAGGGGRIVLRGQTTQLRLSGEGVLVDLSDLTTGGGDIVIDGRSAAGTGVRLLGADIDTTSLDGSGGALRVTGAGSGFLNGQNIFVEGYGVLVESSDIFTGTGAITLSGRNAIGGFGVSIEESEGFSSVRTTSGDISIVGLALAPGVGRDNTGVYIDGTDVNADSGTIEVVGRAEGDAVAQVIGVDLTNGVFIDTLSGDVRLTGESTTSGAGVSMLAPSDDGSGAEVDSGGNVIVRARNNGGADSVVLNGEISAAGVVNLRPGGVDATGAPMDIATDPITIGGSTGFDISIAELALIQAPQLVLGSNTHAGLISVGAAVTRSGNLTLQNGGGGGIALNAPVNLGAGTLALISAGDITQTAAGTITAASLLARSTGGSVALSTASNNVSGTTLAGDALGNFSYTDVDALAIGNVSALGFDAAGAAATPLTGSGVSGGNVFVRNLAGNMTLNAGASAVGDLDLVTAGTLQNAAAASLSAGSRWRVWADTWIGENRGGLAGSGTLPNLYNCSFAGACGVDVPAADNHFIYRQQPLATVTVGDAAREYGLANPAFAFTVGGLVLGDQAANAVSGSVGTSATPLSNVGSYPIDGSFTSPAGYAISLIPGALSITPATLLYVANPFARFLGQPNGTLEGTVTGFRNADTLASATTGTLLFTSPANELSAIGRYPIDGSGLSAINYVFAQAPENATALLVNALADALFLPDLVREPPDNYLYDRNIGSTQLCMVTDTLASTEQKAGDNLAREWSRVRSRPNLTNCVQTNKRYGCSDF